MSRPIPEGLTPKILVAGVDFSPLSRAALDLCVAIARRNGPGAIVHAVHADESGIAPLADIGLAPADDPDLRDALRRDLERELAARRENGVVLTAHVEPGAAAEVLTGAARKFDADLVVLGTHGRKGLTHALLGSVAERVVQVCPVTVLTVPQADHDGDSRGATSAAQRWPFRTIVCGTDFSEGSRVALRSSLSVLPSAEPTLHLVHALEAATFLGRFDEEAAKEVSDDLQRALDTEVKHFSPDGDRVVAHLRGGIVYDEILAAAEELAADLIVLGATGHTGVERALLGSVTSRVVRGSRVPVLVVRPPRSSRSSS